MQVASAMSINVDKINRPCWPSGPTVRAHVSNQSVWPCASSIVSSGRLSCVTMQSQLKTHNWVSLLQHFVNRNQSFECLYFVCQYRLYPQSTPERYRRMVVPCKRNALLGSLLIPLLNSEAQHLLRTCTCFGAVSSGFVAFLIFIPSSWSALSLSTGLAG